MIHIFRIALFSLILVSCKGTSSVSGSSKKEVEIQSETYQVLVQFKNREGLKRILFRLNRFNLELKTEVSASEFLYMLQLNAKPYEIDGIVEKMGLDEDVEWAKKMID